jgi:predicted metalloprotease with PDZ domain
MDNPSSKIFHVQMNGKGIKAESIEFKMPAWTTGYYQMMNYADYVEGFEATDDKGNDLHWEKSSKNGWTIFNKDKSSIIIRYKVKSTRPFVATNYLDEERAYISPAGMFIHPSGKINNPVTIKIKPYTKWSTIATGLDTVKGKSRVYLAQDFDILYDSPFLLGNLESLPSFKVNGIPHYFIGYKLGDFDKQAFMNDLKRVVEAASGIIGEIPYKHYTFIAIGPGGGGIEHLNSTSIAFSGTGLTSDAAKRRMYSFLAHEYFHNYNVKRIRPIELGPFDYDNGSKTTMLWLSEGFTVYYEYVILRRAGLFNDEDVFNAFQSQIKGYESKPGRQFQTPAEASIETWNDGPFGRTGDEVNKTLSPYDKGPVLGWMLDFKIRHETKNKKSLDDLMRLLYQKYYKGLKRGFTETEFRKEAETLAGVSLVEFFEYITTLKEVNYTKYLGYAGLQVDTVTNELPGAWFGATVREQNDSLVVTNVEWKSPAWNAGIRRNNIILAVNGTITKKILFDLGLKAAKAGDALNLRIQKNEQQLDINMILGTKRERSYKISMMNERTELQKDIWESWIKLQTINYKPQTSR